MKKALVTGASRGIDFAIARALVQNGYKVVITGRKLEALEEACEKIGGDVMPLVWDAVKTDTLGQMVEKAVELLGGLDTVVNNAGIFAQGGEWDANGLLTLTPKQWNDVINVNTTALLFTMQAGVKYMREHGIKGNILNVTSVAGEEPVFGAYGASKIAATALTKGWGKMFAPYGITVNGIAPGPVATEMNNWHEGDPMKHDRIPYGRFATIEEIASLAMYLLSDEAKMICGETVILDGAYYIR